MKKIEQMGKKPYQKPLIRVVDIADADLICSSPPGYDGPVGAKESIWDWDEEW